MGYLMFNTFINAILTQWPHTFGANLEKGVENVTGLKAIAGIGNIRYKYSRWYYHFKYYYLDT